MELGLKHLFYASIVTWLFHLGYLLNLSFRQKKLDEEIGTLKRTIAKSS